jgi:general secretion pathway protein H
MLKAETAKIRTSPTGDARRQAGFTLLELLVVLVLLAIIAGIAGGRMIGTLEGPRLDSTANELAAVMRRARGQAILRNRPTAVRVDVGARRFGIPGERVYVVPEAVNVKLFTAVTQQLAADVGEIQFFPDGSSTGGEVTLAGDHTIRYVQVEWLTGRVATYEETPH